MANKPISLLLLLLTVTDTATAAWSTIEAGDINLIVVAVNKNSQGQTTEVFLGTGQTVYLRLSLGTGFETFGITSCPTFQIDSRLPLHHFDVGERCIINKKVATFELGKISDDEIESLVLHRLMNGNNVAFRYTINSGQYRRAQFNLDRSKQALTRVIGADTHIVVP